MEISAKKSLFLIIVATAVLFFIFYIVGEKIFQNKSYDFMVKSTSGNNIPKDDIVLVVIDNKSLSKLGRWPWKRKRTIQIFDYLEYYTDAKVIAYDAIIMAPDENPENDIYFFKNVKKYKKLIAGVGFMKTEFENYINEDEYNKILETKTDVKIIDNRSEKIKNKAFYRSFTPFLKEYLINMGEFASVDTVPDDDGYIRTNDEVIKYNGKLYPSLGLATYSKFTGIKNFTLDNNYLTGKNENFHLHMPITNKDGRVYSNIYFYRTKNGTYSHNTVSASDVIQSLELIEEGKKPILDPEIFKDKAVFVGANANAQALLSDIKATPVSDIFAGVDIHATSFNNMLDNHFYVISNPFYNLGIVAFLFLLVIIYIIVFPTSTALLCTSLTMLLYFSFAFIMYEHRLAIELIVPELFMLFAIGCGYSIKYINEGRKKEKIQSAMSKYISKDVMKNVVQNIDSIKLGGKRAEVTVLFADIRGFTSISEQLSAVEVTKILNEYFSALVPIIEEHKGILNKFMGDAILAIFGEPVADNNHPLNAVLCANKMLKKVRALQEKWILEGKPKIEIGIGISTGEVFVGNIGSETRLEYTVIGDTVNTASRIENYNKVYRTNFLISEETYSRVQKYVDVIKIREVSIRGKAKKINIYEVLRILDV